MQHAILRLSVRNVANPEINEVGFFYLRTTNRNVGLDLQGLWPAESRCAARLYCWAVIRPSVSRWSASGSDDALLLWAKAVNGETVIEMLWGRLLREAIPYCGPARISRRDFGLTLSDCANCGTRSYCRTQYFRTTKGGIMA